LFIEIERYEDPDRTLLDFYLWSWIKSEVYKRNADTQDELLAGVLVAAARIMKSVFNSDEPHAIFIHELLIALRIMVKFSKIYYEI